MVIVIFHTSGTPKFVRTKNRSEELDCRSPKVWQRGGGWVMEEAELKRVVYARPGEESYIVCSAFLQSWRCMNISSKNAMLHNKFTNTDFAFPSHPQRLGEIQSGTIRQWITSFPQRIEDYTGNLCERRALNFFFYPPVGIITNPLAFRSDVDYLLSHKYCEIISHTHNTLNSSTGRPSNTERRVSEGNKADKEGKVQVMTKQWRKWYTEEVISSCR